MKGILFQDKSGKVVSINPHTDYFPVLFISASSVGAIGLLPPLTWVVGLVVLAILHYLNKIEYDFDNDATYKRISDSDLQLFPDLSTLPIRCGLKDSPHYFIDLKESRFSATVRYGKQPIILLSSGLIAELGRRSPRALAAIAHELSHISNRDELYLTLEMAFANWKYLMFLIYAFIFAANPSFHGLASAVIVYRFSRIGLKEIIKRREFFADARAANVLLNSDGYISLLKAGTLDDLPYHPQHSERISNLMINSKVTKPSEITFTIALVIMVNQAANSLPAASIYADFFPDSEMQIPAMLIFVFVPFLAVLAVEALKPWRKLTPIWNAI